MSDEDERDEQAQLLLAQIVAQLELGHTLAFNRPEWVQVNHLALWTARVLDEALKYSPQGEARLWAVGVNTDWSIIYITRVEVILPPTLPPENIRNN